MMSQKAIFAEDAEKSVIGSALVDQGCLQEVADYLTPDDFYVPQNRAIWRTILEVHKAGADVDAVVVAEDLKRSGVFDLVGGAAYMNTLVDAMPSASHVREQAKRIAWCTKRRNTEREAEYLRKLAGDVTATDEEVGRHLESVRSAWEESNAELVPVTLRELHRKRWSSPRWLVDHWWINAGCGFMAADEKSSKTTIAMAMAMSIADGKPFLGRWDVVQGDVLFIGEEDDERQFDRTTRMLGECLNLDGDSDHLHILAQQGVELTTQRGRGRFSSLVRRLKPVLVVLDPLRRVMPGIDENDSRSVSQYLGYLRRMNRETGASFMVLHHNRKEQASGGKTTRPWHRLRGSTDFAAWANSVILISRKNEVEHRVVALHKGPPLPEQRIDVRWDDEVDRLYVGLTASRPSIQPPMASGIVPTSTGGGAFDDEEGSY